MASREDVSFWVEGDRCAAWLYRPAGEGPHPCVVLAHGFAGTREARLWAYAERFQAAGIAAVVFDYRHFGDSEGEPRQLLSIRRQHADWRAAVAFARGLDGIDPERIALWGSSFSGGHVVAIAAGDPRIAAVVSQTPHMSGTATLREAGIGNVLRLTATGMRDAAHALTGREPVMLPAVNRPGELGAMTQASSYEGYHNLFADSDAEFRNEVCGRIALFVAGYSPGRKASKLRCPLLVIGVAGDEVTPVGPARAAAERAPDGRYIEYPGPYGHFDIYVGELFEQTVADQIAFLSETLGV